MKRVHMSRKHTGDILRGLVFIVFVGVVAFCEEGATSNHVRELVNRDLMQDYFDEDAVKSADMFRQVSLNLRYPREDFVEVSDEFLNAKEVIEVHLSWMGYSRNEKARTIVTDQEETKF